MRLAKASLENFRNFTALDVFLGDGINIIYGKNAQGKTNFLESIYFCALGRSARAASDRELVRFGASEARIRMELLKEGSFRTIDAHIQADVLKSIKNIAVDKIHVQKTNELFGILLVVAFSPEDLSLIKSGPAERRAFMDRELCQISPVYCHELRSYHRALKNRNALFKIYKKNGDPSCVFMETLSVLDEQLCKYGRKVMEYRENFVKSANEYASETHACLTGGAEKLKMTYVPNIPDACAYEKSLDSCRLKDTLMCVTNAGPHKDDIKFFINGCDVRIYGSQGQKRTAALSAKLAEIEIIKENAGTAPILLLDDVLSELDEHRQKFLLSRIGGIQTVLTCTGVEDVLKKGFADAGEIVVMQMENGNIRREKN